MIKEGVSNFLSMKLCKMSDGVTWTNRTVPSDRRSYQDGRGRAVVKKRGDLGEPTTRVKGS